MAATLLDRQWELAESLVFGEHTDVVVTSVSVGAPDIRTTDAAPPQMDGTRFGRDELSGRLITFGLELDQEDETVLGRAGEVASVWRATELRREPGAVTTLRYRVGGRDRRVYGRPRRFASNEDLHRIGRVAITADFQCTDDLFYADELSVESVGVVPPSSSGGFDEPMVEPWSYTSVTESRPGSITVGGTEPASPVVTIYGPITGPVFRASGLGDVKINTVLTSAFQSVQIDCRHWVLSVLRETGASLAGDLDWSSPALHRVLLPPGPHTVSLRGEDPTGTARMELAWRDTYAAL